MRGRAGSRRRVDLLQVPGAGEDGDDEAGEVEQGEAEDGVPGEGVADAAVEGVGLVLVEAKDVGAGFGSGRLPRRAAMPVPRRTSGEPEEVGGVKPLAKSEKVSGPGARKKTQIQRGQWASSVEAGVALAE
jgi:hypothetical protein